MNSYIVPKELSSQLYSWVYDIDKNILAITFRDKTGEGPGSTYHYSNVPYSVALTVFCQPSNMKETLGQRFASHVKNGPYPYVLVAKQGKVADL